MKKVTARALEKSIKHWEENVAFLEAHNIDKVSTDADDCALCDRFSRHFDGGIGDCMVPRNEEKCPVFESSGRIECRNTPYNKAWELVDNLIDPITDKMWEKATAACQAEVDFLKSLRRES